MGQNGKEIMVLMRRKKRWIGSGGGRCGSPLPRGDDGGSRREEGELFVSVHLPAQYLAISLRGTSSLLQEGQEKNSSSSIEFTACMISGSDIARSGILMETESF